MTTELIKELVGLAVEKEIRFEYDPSWPVLFFYIESGIEVQLGYKSTPAQLQAAIDRIKSL